jgi:uncharacterized lipoprotein YmbA
MKDFWQRKVLLVLIAGLLSACGSAPPRFYYAMVAEKTRQASGQTLCSRPLVLAAVEAVAPYDSQKIVYRSEVYDVSFYNYRMWAAEPEQMLEELLTRKLRDSNFFPGVETYIHSSSDHLALYTRINALEEVDEEEGEKWNARLALSFVLKEPADDEVIWRYEFDRTERVLERTPRELVKTLSRIYFAETEKMAARLRQFIVGYDGCQEPEHGPTDAFDEEMR